MRRRDFLRDSAGLISVCIPAIAGAQSRPCPPTTLGVSGGATVEGSCELTSLPSWVPAPGTFADISLNAPSAVDPCSGGGCVYSGTSGQNSVFFVWTSGIYAPELGSMGSYVTWGGGHKAYAGNEVYRFDVATRLWSRMGSPSPYAEDTSLGNDGAFPDGKPMPPHTYQTLGIRSSANGGGPLGSLIQATLPACTTTGSGRFGAWWQFSFATETWSKFIDSSSIPVGTLSQKLMVQEPGGNFWWIGGGYLTQIARVSPTGAIKLYDISSNSTYYVCGGVMPGRIMAVHGEWESTMRIRLFDLAAIEAGAATSSATKYITPSGTQPGKGSGLQWCPDLGRFAALQSTSPTTIYWLTPPADPWNGAWTWTTETMKPAGSATSRAIQDGNGSFNRFVWCPPIKSFLWATGRSAPMQAYRPLGT